MTRPTLSELRDALDAANGAKLERLIAEHADDPRAGVQSLLDRARGRLGDERAESRRLTALYRLERDLHRDGITVIAGVDEVGRGALAGPLTAAAVVLPQKPHLFGLNDSKKLTPLRREALSARIREIAVAFCISHVGPDVVDGLGMTEALRRAMLAALEGLGTAVDHVLLDGLPMHLPPAETAVVAGDSSVAAIAAASIIAKVERDRLMAELAGEHPGYGLAVNKGYSTAEHLDAIDRIGPSPIHRRSFAPCAGNLRLFETE